MGGHSMKLDDMSPALRARVVAAMAEQGPWVAPREAARAQVSGGAVRRAPAPAPAVPPPTPAAVRTAKAGGTPNKTEDEYNQLYLGGSGRYEAVTLRLPGGSRYTPDWVTFGADGVAELHEVKGSYRFGSQGRALTAFRECAAVFPCFRFVWATRGKGVAGSWTLKRYGRGAEGGAA